MFPNQKYLHKSTASFVRRKAFRVPGYLALEHMSNLGKGPDNQISYEAFTLLALELSVNVVIHPLLYIIRVNYSGSQAFTHSHLSPDGVSMSYIVQ